MKCYQFSNIYFLSYKAHLPKKLQKTLENIFNMYYLRIKMYESPLNKNLKTRHFIGLQKNIINNKVPTQIFKYKNKQIT